MKFKFYNYSAIIYIAFFCLYFSPFPLNGSFAGNTDVIVHASLFKEYIYHIKEFFGLGVYGHSFYPASGAYMFLENMYGQAIIFILCKLLFLPDYFATYVIVVVLCVLNAISVNKLIFQFTKNKRAAFIFGLFFAASCYMLANLEFLNGISFFPIVFSFYFLSKYFEDLSKRNFLSAIVFLAIQPFFSGYYFLLGGVFLTIYFLLRYIKERPNLGVKHAFFCIGILFICTIPTLLKLMNPELVTAFNPAKAGVFNLDKFTIKGSSFISSFNRNLIYGSFQADQLASFRANNGFIVLILFLAGVFTSFRHKFFLLFSGIVALVLSFGSFDWHIFGLSIPSPFKLLFDWNILGNYFRMPYRFYTIVLLILSIIASFGYIRLEKKIKSKNVLAILIVALFLIENIEYKVYSNDHEFIIQVPKIYESVKRNENGTLSRVADFPSSLFTDAKMELTDNEFRREYFYMYWQTYHQQHILNGSASYFPESRMDNNTLMTTIDQEGHLNDIILNNQLDYIIFHKNLVYHSSELDILKHFKNSSLLNLEKEDNNAVIFKTIGK